MKILFILAAFLLSVRVYASGISTCLEIVYIYKAYLVDQFGDPKTVGYKCRIWDDMPKPPHCRDLTATDPNYQKFVHCKGSKANDNICTFGQFLQHMKLPDTSNMVNKFQSNAKGNLLPANSKDFNPHQTALKLCNHLKAESAKKPVDVNGKKPREVPLYGPYRVMPLDDANYSRMIEMLGEAIVKGKQAGAPAEITNGCLESLDRVIESREGDHGRHLLPAAVAELEVKHGIEAVVKTIPPGYNPFEPNKKWETVDWAATKQKAYNNPTGLTHWEVDLLVNNFKNQFYAEDSPRLHLDVITGYKTSRSDFK